MAAYGILPQPYSQAMYLIDEQHRWFPGFGEQTGPITWLFNHRSAGFFDTHPQFIGHDPAKVVFPIPGAMKQDMIQRLAPRARL